MNLRGIVAVSGKPGLFKLIGQNKTGFILESLDGLKTKAIVNMANAKLASLEDITIFGEDDDLKLIDIFERMKKITAIPDAKADGQALKTFFKEAVLEKLLKIKLLVLMCNNPKMETTNIIAVTINILVGNLIIILNILSSI